MSQIPQLERRLKPNRAYFELSPRMKVALKILEYTDIDKQDIHFSKLSKEMEGEVSRQAIHSSLDSLHDQGTISSGWNKNKDGRWVRGYRPSSEGQKRLLRRTYYATHDDT